ncbi:MAG: hypothetical protein WD649_04355 [Thermoleophilaceae bacterium]
MRKSKPHEVIRKYLDSHGGSAEVQVDALLASWKVDELTDESRRTIEQGLSTGGLATRPPLAGLRPEDAVTVYVVEASEPDAPMDESAETARRGGLLSRFGRRSSPSAMKKAADVTEPEAATPDTAEPLPRPQPSAPQPGAPPAAGPPEPKPSKPKPSEPFAPAVPSAPPEPRVAEAPQARMGADGAPGSSSGSSAELDSLRSERESLRSERDTLRSELERTQREAAQAREEAERQGAEAKRLEAAVQTEQQKVSQAEGRTSLAGKAEEDAKAQAASLRGELEAARAETSGVRSEVESSRSELEAARKRQQELEDAVERERRPKEELERSRTELASARSKAAELIAGARALVTSTTEELLGKTRAISELEIRAGDAELAAQTASRELESHRGHMTELERQLATRREQEQEVEAHLRAEQERGTQSRAAYDAARAEQERLSGELTTLQTAVAEAQRGLAAGIFESEFTGRENSEQKLEQLAADEERVERELVRVGPEAGRRRAELDQAEQRAREVESKLTEVRAGLPELAGEHALAKGRLQALQEAEQGASSDLERLRKELRAARDGLDTLRIDAERRTAELVEAERRLVEVAPEAETAAGGPAAAGRAAESGSGEVEDKPADAPAKRRRFGRRRG